MRVSSPAALGCSSPWVLAVLVAAAQNVLPRLLCDCAAATVAALPIRELALGTMPQEQQPSLLLDYVLLLESRIGLSLLLLLLGGLLMLMLCLSLRVLLMLAGLLLWLLLVLPSGSHGSISTCSTHDSRLHIKSPSVTSLLLFSVSSHSRLVSDSNTCTTAA